MLEKYAKAPDMYADDQDEAEEFITATVHHSSRFDPKVFRDHSMNMNSSGSWSSVMGGGANKLQALQKWFKGESIEGRDQLKKRSDFSELAAVSVRDLVRAIGGSQDAKGNGNSAVSPTMSRSISPESSSPSMSCFYSINHSLSAMRYDYY